MEYSMFDFYKVDCDYEPMIKNYPEGRSHENSIATIPVCYVFKNGVKVDQEIGTHGLPVGRSSVIRFGYLAK
ncbi:hypothetical protein JR316_0000218 [Psilocybe cubensis]|uniref:Uncharacterized protein n=2 Tax=Psilocybe cubensis TaxID=181762 RepID=A0A8H8CQY7_PSICU|nr:hypothetical protein JR316_0000218 [Psilocybe cubensis]KAH9486154.1 hypothetical protein JR316_0000218 [Psilocybe cubensis]